jgi:crotonobetainyl-CoA:carnitine CoA-transferase CaiB-like acyl-CoA transferase
MAVAAAAGLGVAIAGLMEQTGLAAEAPSVTVDRRLASLWYKRSAVPQGWEMPPAWDAIAGDYRCRDGWIKLHTNAPHHRAAALKVLDCPAERDAVAAAVARWEADDLETAIVAEGGVSATMRSATAWAEHPQGQAVAAEPLIDWRPPRSAPAKTWAATPERPLQGLRILDLTRILAGPVSTRALAGFGAEVLRIDPPGWDEPGNIPDVTLGKRCAVLDLKSPEGRDRLVDLLSGADLLVHGYRPGALDGLGLGEAARAAIAPNLIDVCLDAYGWTGPWAERRGYDSLVQMSSGVAEAGMAWAGADIPTPLPSQALDHATGYLMAAAAIRLLTQAAAGDGAGAARLSLARTAELLKSTQRENESDLEGPLTASDLSNHLEETAWGPLRRLRPALTVKGAPMSWTLPASPVGSAPAQWAT